MKHAGEGRPPDDRSAEIDALFSRALDLPPDDRDAFLDRSCRGDPELRALLSDLLVAARESGSFLEGSVEDACELPWAEIFPGVQGDGSNGRAGGPRPDSGAGAGGPAPDRAGERVGAYRLVRRLARGGMASVYLAERADGQFEQRVAIKLLRRGLETGDLVRRFLAERQILSTLEHPNIARLLDGGTTSQGLPYLVMEVVEGTPLVAHCDARRLGVEERLRLFCDVGRAVQHAHRSLVVHRDLKPSNILVDDAGTVKLLDFGIAKLLADEAAPELTRAGFRALTPAYASPEQVVGDPITTASDVYQLGLVLCELLTGRLPYRVRALSPARAEREITEADPTRPSALVTGEEAEVRAASSRELARTLDGDLDLVVLQALRKEPERRYASAEALVDDVERHLRGEPIRARPQTLAYRARKFVGRHRTPVAAAAVLTVALAGSAVLASVQARRLALERDRAVAEEARAHRVTAFLTDLFQVTDPNRLGGDSVSVAALLTGGADRARREFANDPQTQAEVLSAIGAAYQTRGRRDSARAVFERVVGLHRESGGAPAAHVRDLRRLASTLYDRERALALAEDAVEIAERALSPDHPQLALALAYLAKQLGANGHEAGIDQAQERAIAILRGQSGDVRADLANVLHQSALGGGVEHWDRFEEALALRRSLYGEDHTAVAAVLNDMALAIEPTDPLAADTLLERAAEVTVRIFGPEHLQSLQVLGNLAGRYRDRGDFEKAEPLYRELLERRRAAYPADSMGLAFTLHGLGWSLTELGRPAEAEPMLRDVVRLVDPARARANEAVEQMARSTLGRSLAEQGRFEEAEPLLRDSYAWMVENGPAPVFIPFMRDRLIELYEDWGKPDLAARYRAERDRRETGTDS